MSANASNRKTFVIALVMSLVCSVLVAAAAVVLKPKQDENRTLDRQKNILIAGKLYEEGADVRSRFAVLLPVSVDLATGEVVKAENVDKYYKDYARIAREDATSRQLKADADIAKLVRIPNKLIAYAELKDGKLVQLILPIYGKGLWSTLYGFMAVEADGVTVRGLTFYEHGETPGLGGEVDNPRWKEQWAGKKLYDDNGTVQISVLKGSVDSTSPQAQYQVDGLSGASITTASVSSLVRFWAGDAGFGPFLKKVRENGVALWQK